jgi:hypothetical protein
MDSYVKALILWLVCRAVGATDICLMLSPSEEAALSQAQEQAEKIGNPKSRVTGTIRLDGIVFKDPENWTIWVNGRAIKSGQTNPDFQILKVTPDQVEMIWTKNGESHQISLKPNENAESLPLIP